MLDFLKIKHKETTRGKIEVYPDFIVSRSKDLMIRGNAFYAIWNYKTEKWSTDEYDVQLLVDHLLKKYAEELQDKTQLPIRVKYLSAYSSNSWSLWKMFISKLSDQSEQLDNKIVFSNTDTVKKDHISRTLEYAIDESETPAFDELFGTLYDTDELEKLMWAIGSIISGDSRYIQKFFVLFGAPGTGKSTALNLIQDMFSGYYTTFEAQALTSGNNSFSTEIFRNNPLIGINHEGNLSKVTDNSLLNSLVAHDQIIMNVKYHKSYPIRLNTMLFIATNNPVTITDSKSGLIRRLIDIRPTGQKVDIDKYLELLSQITFEYGGIANKCLDLYLKLGKSYYDKYKPVDMMLRTNVMYNFVDEYFFDFQREGYITLARAWKMYKEFCETSNIKYRLQRHKFRDEFKSYWEEFYPYKRIDDKQYRSVFEGFKSDLFRSSIGKKEKTTVSNPGWLDLYSNDSHLDEYFKNQPAQYASKKNQPKTYWDDVNTVLSDIDTTKLHFILPTKTHIVIDFDIKDHNGEKSLEKNLEVARAFPKTYAEVSKGGSGLHLHYEYDGDVEKLSRVYDVGIEILKPTGKFSIRRKVSFCNTEPVVTISSGLPVKGDTNMISDKVVKSEKGLRSLILRNLQKEIHPATKPSIDFIAKILEDAKDSGLKYDVSDMKSAVLNFASNSTNHSLACVTLVLSLPFENGYDHNEPKEIDSSLYKDDRLVFYDVEVFPNLLLICWKFGGEDTKINRLFNPTPEEVGQLFKYKLVGFNNRRYDNHILYGRYLGLSLQEIYILSSRIVSNDRSAMFSEAYQVSFIDVYDYASKKQSLKKWQVELGMLHKELDLPWDKPVGEEQWDIVAEYCDNDVFSLEALHKHLKQDYNARLILSDISGLPPNNSTLSHTSRIVFGFHKNPQKQFVYPDLSKEFPGYTFDRGVSKYRGEVVGEGGYVFSKPGIYNDVLYMDIASMHPRSIEVMNLFGPFTKHYSDIKKARIAIKEGDLDTARLMYGGKLSKYLDGDINELAYALKIVINIVYGMTFASFNNPFKDPRNIDNVVAKRGALFMVDLKHALEEQGINAVHFKTDSVKIADFKPEDEQFIIDFGLKYGYDFGVEGVFENMALLNNADLVGKWKNTNTWTSVGARMSKPYVFKTLFSKKPIVFEDLVETRAVTGGAIYLNLGSEEDDNLVFIGKVGSFCPIKESAGGGTLLRIKDGNKYSVSGTKGFRWLPADMVRGVKEDAIDLDYFENAVNAALNTISKVGDINHILDR